MKPLMAILLLFFSLSMTAQGADLKGKPAQVEPTPAHTPEWTNLSNSDPGTSNSVIPELQGIVVLCATEPGSAEFKTQWAAYVRQNYTRDMNVDAVIDNVLKQADAYRAKQRKGSKPSQAQALQSNDITRKNMRSTATAVIR